MSKVSKEVKITERKITDLKFTNLNPVKHSRRNKEAIKTSLNELGGGRSVLIDENDTLVAGNGTTEQAQESGQITRVIEVEVPDRHTLVAVKRTDLTEEEKLRMAMFDNGAAKLAQWDAASLVDINAQGISLDGILTPKEFEKLRNPRGADIEPPSAEELPNSGSRYYLIVECDTPDEQAELYESLLDSGCVVTKYEGKK